jgi:hypothetical protein
MNRRFNYQPLTDYSLALTGFSSIDGMFKSQSGRLDKMTGFRL